jgi:hypothetical protein
VRRPSSDDENGARGCADDTPRDAAHQQTAYGAVTAPAHDDHIGPKSFSLGKDSGDWDFVYDNGLCVRPPLREHTPCPLGGGIGTLIEGRQKN